MMRVTRSAAGNKPKGHLPFPEYSPYISPYQQQETARGNT
jgi:hypothetical protein